MSMDVEKILNISACKVLTGCCRKHVLLFSSFFLFKVNVYVAILSLYARIKRWGV